MKTTLDLPEDLLREMKLRALAQGRDLRDLVAEFLRQGLNTGMPRPATPPLDSRVVTGADGLPVIRGAADAPARFMSTQALTRLEQDLQTHQDMQGAGHSF
jgi:plasmid stability protein